MTVSLSSAKATMSGLCHRRSSWLACCWRLSTMISSMHILFAIEHVSDWDDHHIGAHTTDQHDFMRSRWSQRELSVLRPFQINGPALHLHVSASDISSGFLASCSRQYRSKYKMYNLSLIGFTRGRFCSLNSYSIVGQPGRPWRSRLTFQGVCGARLVHGHLCIFSNFVLRKHGILLCRRCSSSFVV